MMRSSHNDYGRNGVAVKPENPRANSDANIYYNGLLVNNGANAVFARVGFGQRWQGERDYKMDRSGNGFAVTIPVAHADTLNLCFKDGANHWDNNSGRNYSFNID